MKYSKLKSILLESILETLNQSQGDFDYVRGQKFAVIDKQKGIENRDISNQSKEFKRGYASVMGGWWQKFNDKLSRYVGSFGYGNQR